MAVDKIVIGARIKALREVLKLTQTEFISGSGFKRETLQAIESGKQFPTIDFMAFIVNKYDIPYEGIIEGKNLMHSPSDFVNDIKPIYNEKRNIEECQRCKEKDKLIEHHYYVIEQLRRIIDMNNISNIGKKNGIQL